MISYDSTVDLRAKFTTDPDSVQNTIEHLPLGVNDSLLYDAMAARERTAEVGVLKTLGFARGQLLRLVLAESLAVGVLGAALGCGLCAVLMPVVGALLAKMMPVFGTLRMSGGNWATGLAIGVGIGLLSGLGPAVASARLRIVDAVRRVA